MTNLLRTPDHHFDKLPDFPYTPHYININDARIHYVDEGEGETILCLHSNLTWCYNYRYIIEKFKANYRIIAPDFIGCGKSDKYPNEEDYSFELYVDMLLQFIERMDIRNATLVVKGCGGMLGLYALKDMEERIKRLVILNTYLSTGERELSKMYLSWRDRFNNKQNTSMGKTIDMATFGPISEEVLAAYDAPFPADEYKSGIKFFANMIPDKLEHPIAPYMHTTRAFMQNWNKPVLLITGKDSYLNRGGNKWYVRNLPQGTIFADIEIEDARHFLCEDKGTEIAGHIGAFLVQTS